MVETVRRLVGFGTRMYGTPSNHEAAAWLASQFREAGLEVQVRQDTPRDWYQPVSWEIRTALGHGRRDVHRAEDDVAEFRGALRRKGRACCRSTRRPAPCASCRSQPDAGDDDGMRGGAVRRPGGGVGLADGRPAARHLDDSGVRVSPRESTPLRERVTAGEKVRVSLRARGEERQRPGRTVVATLPGKDRSKYILFCAHGDSDSGGPGAERQRVGRRDRARDCARGRRRRQVGRDADSRRGTCASRPGAARCPRRASTSRAMEKDAVEAAGGLQLRPVGLRVVEGRALRRAGRYRGEQRDHHDRARRHDGSPGRGRVPGARGERQVAGRHRLVRLPAARRRRDGLSRRSRSTRRPGTANVRCR